MKKLLYLLGCLIFLISCEPKVDDKPDFGALPSADFVIESTDDPNTFVFKSTAVDAFAYHWDFGNGLKGTGEQVETFYQLKGDYEVEHIALGSGGSDVASKSVEVLEDAPISIECIDNMKKLTGCDTKTWRLAPEENAMHVGPAIDQKWWGNSEQDLLDRACHFNDEYLFSDNTDFEYKSNGDFWADTDGDGNITPSDLGLESGCQSSEDWPEAYQVWDSNVHQFFVTDSTLILNGEGAWMGLYKIGTSGEVASPQSSVTFKISEITETRMVLFTDYGDAGVWRLTFVSE